MAAIRTEGLTKFYGRNIFPAVADLNLSVEQGEVFGFLGPNGAGKTTTIRILMTLLRPTKGRAWVNGFDVLKEPQEAMRRVGFIPENPGFYPYLTGRRHLKYYARLYGRRPEENGWIDGLLARVGLKDAGDEKVGTYSLGMRRRLALAGALLPDPEVLILDEPSLGLDPQGIAFVRVLLRALQRERKTIFLSSHLLSEVERICSRVAILHRGRCLGVDAPKSLAKAIGGQGGSLVVETTGVKDDVRRDLEEMDEVVQVDLQGSTLRISGPLGQETVSEINRRLVGAGVDVLSLRRHEPDLEQAFLSLTEGGA